MRGGIVLFITLMALQAIACSPESEALDPARRDVLEVEVRETLADLTAAMNQHDPDQVIGYYRRGEEFLYLGCTDVLLGWEPFSIREANYHRSNPEVVFQRDILRVQILSDRVAVAALRGGSSRAEALFWTHVLVKGGDGWKITYTHESWPGCPQPSAPHPFTMPSDSLGLMPVDTVGLPG